MGDFWDSFRQGQGAADDMYQHQLKLDQRAYAQQVRAAMVEDQSSQQQQPPPASTPDQNSQPAPASATSDPNAPTAPVAPVASAPLADPSKLTQQPKSLPVSGSLPPPATKADGTPATDKAEKDGSFKDLVKSLAPYATPAGAIPAGASAPTPTTNATGQTSPLVTTVASPTQPPLVSLNSATAPATPQLAQGPAIPAGTPTAGPAQPLVSPAASGYVPPGAPGDNTLNPIAAQQPLPGGQPVNLNSATAPATPQLMPGPGVPPGTPMASAGQPPPPTQAATYSTQPSSTAQAQPLPGGVSSPPTDVRGFPPQPASTAQQQPLPASVSSPQASLGSKILGVLGVSTAYGDERPGAAQAATPAPAAPDPDAASKAANAAAGYSATPGADALRAVGAALKPADGGDDAAYMGTAPTGQPDTQAPKSPIPSKGQPPAAAAATTAAPASKDATPTPAGTTALPAPAARVTPDQQGPSQQSEAPVAYTQFPLDPRPAAALKEQSPEMFDKLDNIARQYNVDVTRLAVHGWLESHFDPNVPDHKNPNGTVDIGPFQINSATMQDLIKRFPQDANLDPRTMEGGATFAAQYIQGLDGKFGKNNPASVGGYNGGPGAGDAIVAGKGNPNVVNYVRAAYMGQDVTSQPQQPPANPPSPQAMQNAAQQGGPDGVLKLVANSAPGAPMSDKWRAAEVAGVYAALERGDQAGAAGVQDFILQQQQQGANQNIMKAYACLQTGNGVGAAQFLAKAHAFVNDGAMGRFGVDDKNQVWGQMLDEKTGQPNGKPFLVDSNSLGALMVQTRDINKFNALATDNEKAQASIASERAHGTYYSNLIAAKNYATDERAQAAQQADKTKEGVAMTAGAARVQAATLRGRQGAVNGATDAEISKELTSPLTVQSVNGITDPDKRAAAASAYSDLRKNGHGGPDADMYIGGILSQRYKVGHQPGNPSGILLRADGSPVYGGDGKVVQFSPHVADAMQDHGIIAPAPKGPRTAQNMPPPRNILNSSAMPATVH